MGREILSIPPRFANRKAYSGQKLQAVVTLARSAAVSVRASRWRCKAAQELGEPHERIEMKKTVFGKSLLCFFLCCVRLCSSEHL